MRADAAQLLSAVRQAAQAFRGLGRTVDSTTQRLARVGTGARTAATGLRDLGRQSAATRASLRSTGADGHASMSRIQRGTSAARQELHHLRNLVVGGGIVAGLAEIAHEGNEYQRAINKWGAVTGASGSEMIQAAAKARQLGSDLAIPGTSAAKAADAMLELAKAGQTSTSSIANARAAMQLAAADNLSAADAARFLGDVMDQFGLSSNNAGRAADVLAAGANAASGGLEDIYTAMSYTGPVAAQLGVSLEDTAASVAMLARAGILGSKAGTTMRGMLTNLAKPTDQMRQGLRDMGIEAWDAQGNFRGLRTVIDGFEKAQHRMSQQDFLGSLAKVVGKPALAGAAAMAHQGASAFDQMRAAVARTGAAGEIAASQTKGLAGAYAQLRTQAKNTGQTLYTAAAPGLEKLTRWATSALGAATPRLASAITYGQNLVRLVGPRTSSAIARGWAEVKETFSGLGGSAKQTAFNALANGLSVLLNAGRAAMEVLRNLGAALSPIGHALSEVANGAGAGSSALGGLALALNLALSGLGAVSAVLRPVGQTIAGIVQGFAALPGPVQAAVASLMLATRINPMLLNLGRNVSGPVTSAFRGFGDQMRVQAQLAAASGQSIGRIGQALAVMETRIPVVGQMTAAFRSASSPINGVARAMGAGLGGAARGLMGALGGPWGAALAAAGVGLSLFADHQRKAAQAAAEHQARISNLTQALRESNGAVTDSVRAAAVQQLMDAKVFDGKKRLVDVMGKAGVTVRQLTDAYLSQDGGLENLQKQLRATAKEQQTTHTGATGMVKDYTEQGLAAARAADALGSVKGEMSKALQDSKNMADAMGGAGKGAQSAVGPFGQFTDAMRRLSDTTADADSRARALHDALNVLAGGSVNFSAAQARMNKTISDAKDSIKSGVDQADGFGTSLLNVDGSLSTVTRNGQRLFDVMQGLSTSSAEASLAAYQYAQTQGKTVPESLQAAQDQMAKAREAAIATAEGYGLQADQAAKLADAAGLVPSQVSILLQTAGMEPTMAQLVAVQQQLRAFPSQKTITISSLDNEARAKLESLGFKIKDIPETRQVQVTAPTDGARASLDALIGKIASTPGSKNVAVSAGTQGAISSLEELKGKLQQTHGKEVTITAPTQEARDQVEQLGFKITDIHGKEVTVSVPTGNATSQVSQIQGAINGLQDKTVTISIFKTEYLNSVRENTYGPYADGYRYGKAEANGGVLEFYAGGGIRSEDHVAQIAKGGTWRVWAEPETHGEAYIPLAASKRPRSKAILGEVARRFGGEVVYHASGGLTDWTYNPGGGPQLFTVSDIASKSTKKDGDSEKFDLDLFEKNLAKSARTAEEWRRNLASVSRKAGTDVSSALEAMGTDSVDFVKKMANGSGKYINEMAEHLRKLSGSAKNVLTDYNDKLGTAIKGSTEFQNNLAQLANSGFRELASRLAAQGDDNAKAIAAEAVRDRGKAKQTNDTAKNAGNVLDGEQLTDLLKILGALQGDRGIHAVADVTGLEEDRLIAVANAGKDYVRGAGAKANRFLNDLVKANAGKAYADGGLWEPGVYSSPPGRDGLIKFAERSTGGEAYLPLGPAKRARSTAVLGQVADRFGLAVTPKRLVDASSGRTQVVIVHQAPAIGSQTINVSRSSATPEGIASAVAYQVRRAKRGGVLR
ncbi:phage tail tape measure protein [Streptomyces sp. NPDC049555]|uniref:phage tail tape measure protein n=1 Tax=Streptomyces sp. NPDC049555 TaxID=3154930 RepID=UPI003429B280